MSGCRRSLGGDKGTGWLLIVLLTAVPALSAAPGWRIEDGNGVLAQTEAPVTSVPKLSKRQATAAREGRLGLRDSAKKGEGSLVIPVQWEAGEARREVRAVWLMPPGAVGERKFQWCENKASFSSSVVAREDSTSGQVDIREDGRPVLRYNYKTTEPGAVLDKVAAGNRIYARPRSDYIHPLYGLQGEELTRDWSIDHPHHRGIYWAWPEVDFGTNRGDLHALQKVFARPTGKLRLESGPVYAQIEAQNVWMWEDREAMVRETAVIRAYRSTAQGRVVDLAFSFEALKDGVSVARRGTEHYGGLNVRMATPASQAIVVRSDPSSAGPRRAWSDLSGVFEGAGTPSGLMVLQYRGNPDYPGDWVQYPNLSWCQPTFPAARTRYELQRGRPLVLRYRLVVHAGTQPDEAEAARLWDALQEPSAAVPAPNWAEMAK